VKWSQDRQACLIDDLDCYPELIVDPVYGVTVVGEQRYRAPGPFHHLPTLILTDLADLLTGGNSREQADGQQGRKEASEHWTSFG
jgi:hypothetical protein